MYGIAISRGTGAAATFVTRVSTLWFAVALGLPALVAYTRRKHVKISGDVTRGSGVRDTRERNADCLLDVGPLLRPHDRGRGRGGTSRLDRAKEMVRLAIRPCTRGSSRRGVPPRARRAAGAARIADRHKVNALVAVATSAVREAKNGGEFVRAARDEVGIDVRVIRGDEEARLIYLGARGSLDLGKRRVALSTWAAGRWRSCSPTRRSCTSPRRSSSG